MDYGRDIYNLILYVSMTVCGQLFEKLIDRAHIIKRHEKHRTLGSDEKII